MQRIERTPMHVRMPRRSALSCHAFPRRLVGLCMATISPHIMRRSAQSCRGIDVPPQAPVKHCLLQSGNPERMPPSKRFLSKRFACIQSGGTAQVHRFERDVRTSAREHYSAAASREGIDSGPGMTDRPVSAASSAPTPPIVQPPSAVEAEIPNFYATLPPYDAGARVSSGQCCTPQHFNYI